MNGMEVAASHLGGMEAPEPQKPLKEFHAKELHDGTYHVMMHHGDPMKPPTEGSAQDVEGVHDHMHSHFSGGGEMEKGGMGEGGGEKGEKKPEKPSMAKKNPKPEPDDKPAGADTDE